MALGETLEIVGGTDKAWTQTLCDSLGNPLTTYTSVATFTVFLWSGEDQVPLSPVPVAAWTNAPGGAYALSCPAAVTVALSAGIYRLRVLVTQNGQTGTAFDGRLSVAGGPGSAAVPTNYCTYQDMKDIWPSIEKLQPDDAESGFANQRGAARAWIETLGHKHYRAGIAVPQNQFAYFGDGLGIYRSGRRNFWLQQQFDADFMVITEDLSRVCALYALGKILMGQLEKDDKGIYRKQGVRFAVMADAQAKSLVLELDTTGTGYSDIVIPLGLADTLMG